MHTLILSGGRNPKGQTARAAAALADGLKSGGATSETIHLATMKIERCRQCDDAGWGLCRKEGRCVIDDDFAGLVDKMRAADAIAFANPVYYGDLSESLKAFLDRFRRLNETGKRPTMGKPAIGICVAGGSGGGAPNCCMLLERTLATCGFDVIDMVPARRQNLDMKVEVLRTTGKWMASAAK